jgi:hypothetical protein
VSSVSLGIPPVPPHVSSELNKGEALNVKQISVAGAHYPAVLIHGLADARAVLALRRPVTLLSAPGAALFAGSGWWRALIQRARGEFPQGLWDDILDCADASGLALGALRIGQRRIVLDVTAPGRDAVTAIAASLGGEVLTVPPDALDMSERGAARRLPEWLGDSRRAVS